MKTKTEVELRNESSRVYRYRVFIHRDEDGIYIAECPALQGCVTDGKTFEEAMEMLEDAITLNIKSRIKTGDLVPEDCGWINTEVSVSV